MSLRKSTKAILFSLFLLFISTTKVYAVEDSFVTIINPIRGEEFWTLQKQSALDGVRFEKEVLDKNSLAATWLLRFDALTSFTISTYVKDFNLEHELGIFLEITPSLAKAANVSYSQGGVFWHDSNKIFLSGYKPEDRLKLIDIAFSQFKDTFGYYPKSVGAWHVDAFSSEYMEKKYGVTGVLICADQFSTDNYQIWGGWWGVPYYPSKFNILTPAQTVKNKLNVVIFWWAARDPELAYEGNSAYSVQPNDYTIYGRDIEYFKVLLDLYLDDDRNTFGQVTIGLENDYETSRYGGEYFRQMEEVSKRRNEVKIKVLTMKEFSSWYIKKNKGVSPDHYIKNWLMSPLYRLGFTNEGDKKFIRDLRIYNENWPESNLMTANPWAMLSLNNPYKIDSLRFPLTKLDVTGQSVTDIVKSFNPLAIPFKISEKVLRLFYLFLISLVVYVLRKKIPLLILALSGTVSLSIPMVKSGLIYPFGMGFWGPNGHDGIWHISLINQLAKFSFDHPVFAGEKVTNYHFGFDFLVAALHRLTRIPVINLYFQIIPPVMALLIGLLTYKFVKKWVGSEKSAWWATFFVYFGGSWGWLVSFFRNRTFGGESMFWASQSVYTLINPPYSLSLIFMLLGLIKFLDFRKSQKVKDLILCSILFGLLAIVKVYAGIIVLGALASGILFYNLIYQKKNGIFFKVFAFSLVVTLVTFLPFNTKASSLLLFQPLWFLRTMLSSPDRLNWPRLENASFAYFHSGKWFKWICAEILALSIFVLGNLGTRILALGELKKRSKFFSLTEMEVIFWAGASISFLIPLLFIQKGTTWNTIQFFYYFQILTGILAGIWWGRQFEAKGLFKRKSVKVLATISLIILTLPTTFATLADNFIPQRSPARISMEELEALDFLKKQPDGIVLTCPHGETWNNLFSEPKPLYAYETTGYVSALTGKQSFLEDEMNLEISGYDWRERREDILKFFNTNQRDYAADLIINNKIAYLYIIKGQPFNLGENDINAEKIFENGEVRIYQIYK